jgi:hypothetical protein
MMLCNDLGQDKRQIKDKRDMAGKEKEKPRH